MFKKLDSDRAKVLYSKIEREKQKVNDSIHGMKNCISEVKESAAEVVEHPLDYVMPQQLNDAAKKAPKYISKNPLSSVLIGLAVGWGIARLVKGQNGKIKHALSGSTAMLGSAIVNSSVAEKLSEEFSRKSSAAIDQLVNTVQRKAEGFLESFIGRPVSLSESDNIARDLRFKNKGDDDDSDLHH